MTENASVLPCLLLTQRLFFLFLVKPESRCQIEDVRVLKAEGQIVSKKSS